MWLWIKTFIYLAVYKFPSTLQKVQDKILIIYDASTDNRDTFHPEGKLSASLKRLCNYFVLVFCWSIGEKTTQIPCVSTCAGFWCVFVISLCPCLCARVLSGFLTEPDARAWYDKSLWLQTDRCSSSDNDLSIEHGCENKAVSCDYVPSAAPTWGILCAGYSRDPADWRHTELND